MPAGREMPKVRAAWPPGDSGIVSAATNSRRSPGILLAAFVGSAFMIIPLGALVFYGAAHHARVPQASQLYVAIYNSVLASLVSLVLVVAAGLPLGYYLFASHTRLARALAVCVRLPLGVPPMVAGVMLLVAFGPNSVLGRLFGGHLTNSLIAIVIAQSFAALPYVVEGARGAYGAIDTRALVVARSLRVPPAAELALVSVPLAWPAIRSSIVLAYLRAFGEFGAVLLVAFSPYSLPTYTYVVFEGSGLPATALPIAATLLASGLIALAISKVKWPTATLTRWLSYSSPHGQERSEGQLANQADNSSQVRIWGTAGAFRLDVDFEIHPGCTVFLGPSGSGKTLTLNALSHFPLGDLQVRTGGTLEAARQLPIAYVPQVFGLFPHLSLEGNLRFAASFGGGDGLKNGAILDRLDLAEFASRMPTTLSGGQLQRGALARALATRGEIVVLDEPLSALDAPRRGAHLRLIDNVVKPSARFVLVVTHDVEEAAYLADWLVVIKEGRVLQQGTAGDVLASPASPEVAAIIGADNVLPWPPARGSAPPGRGLACFSSKDVRWNVLEGPLESGWTSLGNARAITLKRSPLSHEVRFELGGREVIGRGASYAVATAVAGQTYSLWVPTSRLWLFGAQEAERVLPDHS